MILIEEINKYGTTLAYNHDKVLIAKSCGKCKELKSLSFFHKTKRCKLTGTVSSCGACLKDFHHKYYRKNTRTFKSNYDENGLVVSRECSKCKKLMTIDNFHMHKKGKDGYNAYCVECTSEQGKDYRAKIPEKLKARSRNYYKNNLHKVKTSNGVRHSKLKNQRAFYKNFEKEIFDIYSEALRINESGVTRVAVDHIIPVLHKNVCGLHCPKNLRITEYGYNCSKGNKWDGTHENANWETDWRKSREQK